MDLVGKLIEEGCIVLVIKDPLLPQQINVDVYIVSVSPKDFSAILSQIEDTNTSSQTTEATFLLLSPSGKLLASGSTVSEVGSSLTALSRYLAKAHQTQPRKICADDWVAQSPSHRPKSASPRQSSSPQNPTPSSPQNPAPSSPKLRKPLSTVCKLSISFPSRHSVVVEMDESELLESLLTRLSCLGLELKYPRMTLTRETHGNQTLGQLGLNKPGGVALVALEKSLHPVSTHQGGNVARALPIVWLVKLWEWLWSLLTMLFVAVAPAPAPPPVQKIKKKGKETWNGDSTVQQSRGDEEEDGA
jgi:hypothetical protein